MNKMLKALLCVMVTFTFLLPVTTINGIASSGDDGPNLIITKCVTKYGELHRYFVVTIKNNGTEAIPAYTTIETKFEAKPIFFFFGKYTTETLETKTYINLEPGMSFLQQFKVPSFGLYLCTFTVDPNKKIPELNDLDNSYSLFYMAFF